MTPEAALILVFLFNAFAIIGINRATEYESINDELYGIVGESKSAFWWIRFYSLKYFGDFWTMTICSCPKCMATVHGTYFFAFFYFAYADSWTWLLFYPMYWFALSGFAHALNMGIGKLEN